MVLEQREIDDILAVVLEQRLQGHTVAIGLVALPQPRRDPPRDAGRRAGDAEQLFDLLQATA